MIKTTPRTKIISNKQSFVTKRMFIDVLNQHKNPNFTININDDKIDILDNDNNLINLEDLTYKSKDNCIKISDILKSLITHYQNSNLTKYYKQKDDIENSVLYVFLIPELTKNKKYIIKVGYTTNLLQRYSELKKEHNVESNSDIFLIYVSYIKNEAVEKKLHNILKSNSQNEYYPTIKNKDSTHPTKCTETYVFSLTTYKNIISELYKLKSKNKDTIKINDLEQKLSMLQEKFKLLEEQNKLLEDKNKMLQEENNSLKTLKQPKLKKNNKIKI
jgi:hypothetical protein